MISLMKTTVAVHLDVHHGALRKLVAGITALASANVCLTLPLLVTASGTLDSDILTVVDTN